MPPLFLAELPEYVPWFIVACVFVAIIAMVGLGITLRFVKELRTNVAEELRAEIGRAKEPTAMTVQQPLIVKEHNPHVTSQEHQQLRSEFSDLRAQRTKDVAGLHKKIEDGLRFVGQCQVEQGKEIVELKTQNTGQTRQLTNLDQKMDRVLERLPRSQ